MSNDPYAKEYIVPGCESNAKQANRIGIAYCRWVGTKRGAKPGGNPYDKEYGPKDKRAGRSTEEQNGSTWTCQIGDKQVNWVGQTGKHTGFANKWSHYYNY